MIYRRLAICIISYRLALVCLASEETFSLSGRVVNKSTGVPVARAMVSLAGSFPSKSPKEPNTPTNKQTFTDAAGNFNFSALPASSYSLSARKPGFQFPEAGEPIVLGPSRNNIQIALPPLNSIEGFVTDSAGAPLQGIQLQLLSLNFMQGQRRISIERSVATDDRGYYRFWNLRDGQLFLKAMGRSGGNTVYMTERTPSFVAHETFAPLYWGGASSIGEATPLSFANGQEQQANFRLTLQPAFRIRGKVSNLQGYKPAEIELFSSNEDVAANRSSLNAISGAFEIYDVVPGAYRLRITQGEGPATVLAETQVQVSSADVLGIQLQASAGVDIKILSTLSASPASGPSDLAGAGRSRVYDDTAECRLALRSDIDPAQAYEALFGPNKSLDHFPSVLPGQYFVRTHCYSGYITSMMFGTSDVMATKKLNVQAGVPPPPLTIHAQVGGGRVEFDFKFQNSERALLVPAFQSAEGVRLIPDTAGKLAPGDYTIYLVKDDQIPYADPNYLQTLRNGLNLRIQDAQTTRVSRKDLER